MNFLKNKKPVIICDIGASPVDKTNFIDNLFDNTFCRIIGFEPNKAEFEKLDNTSPNKKYYNFAIGDGTKKTLNICGSPGMSSFLEPDYEYLSKFHLFERLSKVIQRVEVKTKKLNDITDEIDFFKIDVQGYESEIIKNGKDKIKDALVVQIETSPVPLYKKEKSFSYVISQLEDLGYCLHMFNNINTRIFKPMLLNNNPYKGIHHLFQLDCVMIKNFEKINKLNEDKLIKLILILFYSFKSYDLVDYLITILDKKYKTNYISNYRNLLTKQKTNKIY